MAELPYFDLLLAHPEEPVSQVFRRFVHWGYWENPRQARRDFADFTAAMERLNDEVVGAAALEDGQAVLDAGCGFGGTLASIFQRRRGMSLTGLNIDPRQLEQARPSVPSARFVEGDACAMPFPDLSFDRVLAVECVFHFPSRLRFLKEAARVLKSGGRAALSDFVPVRTRGGAGPVGRWIERKIAVGYGSVGDGWEDGGYAEMADKAGLRLALDRDITAHTLPTYPVLLDLLRESPAGGESMLGPTRLLQWLSRLRLLRYRLVAFEKP